MKNDKCFLMASMVICILFVLCACTTIGKGPCAPYLANTEDLTVVTMCNRSTTAVIDDIILTTNTTTAIAVETTIVGYTEPTTMDPDTLCAPSIEGIEAACCAVTTADYFQSYSDTVEGQWIGPVNEQTETTETVSEYLSVSMGYITEEERIMLCNTVGSEYGSDWVPVEMKAQVVDSVMSRVKEGCWTNGLPSNVKNVLTAPNQYNPWYADTFYHDNVTESCIEAVEYYFQHQNEYPHFCSFTGDGTYNYFY